MIPNYLDLTLAAVGDFYYPKSEIFRLHSAANVQMIGALKAIGPGITQKYGATSLAVSAGVGLLVSVAPGAALLGADNGAVYYSERSTAFSLAVPASSTSYVHALIETGTNDTRTSGLPLLLVSGSEVEPGGELLAQVTTSASAVTAVVDRRSWISSGGGSGQDGQDGQDGEDGADGVGVPAGGTTGQILAKTSNTDFDTQWVTPSNGEGGGDAATVGGATKEQLRDRSTHTGTQLASTISDLTESVQDVVGSFFVAGAGIQFSYNDASNTFTVINSAPLTTEAVQDVVGAMVAAGANITSTYNDTNGTLTIASTGGAAMTTEEVQDIVAGLLAAGTNVTLSYNDAGNALTITAAGGGGGGSTNGTEVQTLSGPYGSPTFNAGINHVILECDHTSQMSLTVPTAVGNSGKKVTYTQIGVGTVYVAPQVGGETISGAANKSTTGQWDGFTLYSNGTHWRVLK